MTPSQPLPPDPTPAPAERKTFRCAICAKVVAYAGPLPALFPFCSEHCKLVDLYRWFSGAYRIDRDLTPDELPETDEPPPPD